MLGYEDFVGDDNFYGFESKNFGNFVWLGVRPEEDGDFPRDLRRPQICTRTFLVEARMAFPGLPGGAQNPEGMADAQTQTFQAQQRVAAAMFQQSW
jgi:hypothetical protein